MTPESCDYLIIGGGTAGCLLANRLSADGRHQVTLIEAGGRDNYPWIHIPVGYLYCIGNPRTDWIFRTRAEPGLNGRSLLYPRGRVLGGSSSINGMIYMRGQAADYDSWRDAGNPGWGWQDVLPIFKRTEDHALGASEFHGAGGEWRVEAQRLSWEILDGFRDAARESGIPTVTDFNRGDNTGCGYFEVNQRSGVRWNASKAFLRPALKRPNLRVLTGAHVNQLTFSGNRATGVSYWQDGVLRQLLARGETILAAGAVGSPTLLESSGVGAPELLARLGIPVQHALPGVGENLQDHLQLRMAFRVSNTRTLNTIVNSLTGKLAIGLEYALWRRGPMSMSPSQLGAFARSDERHTRANLEYHVQPLSLDRFGEPLHTFDAFTASVCNLRPQSRGTVHIESRDSRQPPIVAPNYLDNDEDRLVAVESLRLTRRIAAAPPLARFKPEEFAPGPQFQTSDELARAAGDIGTTIFHPVGTCKMGNDDRAVVDHELRVRGLTDLRVIDASIMPTITAGNTCSPTLMIAEKGSDMLLAAALARRA